MDKFEKSVKPGGVLIYDPNGIIDHPTRNDINIYQIEGSKLAAEMGNKKIFNMVIMGAFLKIKPIVKLENVIAGLKKSLPERYHHLIPLNEEALKIGMNNVTSFKDANQLASN
jgi:2-oxoglutarate ferredoxin oxidoreductase subunit gamma